MTRQEGQPINHQEIVDQAWTLVQRATDEAAEMFKESYDGKLSREQKINLIGAVGKLGEGIAALRELDSRPDKPQG